MDSADLWSEPRVDGFGTLQILVLSAMAGAFITAGALFSLLLGSSVEPTGPQLLLEGLGFSSGFFFVILSSTILFTEANVAMPSTFLACRSPVRQIAPFWGLALVGNLVGALVVGGLIALAQDYPAEVTGLLDETLEKKLAYREAGGVGSWFEIIVSGMLANWLVGMAAFFATMGQTIAGKFIPVFLAVTLFVAANFQHSPANMGYFSLGEWTGAGPGWDVALAWSIIPAGTVNGGVFGLIQPSLGDGHPIRNGLGFGAAVMASSYVQLVPMGLSEVPWKYSPRDLATELGFHLAYGLGVGLGWVLVRDHN